MLQHRRQARARQREASDSQSEPEPTPTTNAGQGRVATRLHVMSRDETGQVNFIETSLTTFSIAEAEQFLPINPDPEPEPPWHLSTNDWCDRVNEMNRYTSTYFEVTRNLFTQIVMAWARADMAMFRDSAAAQGGHSAVGFAYWVIEGEVPRQHLADLMQLTARELNQVMTTPGLTSVASSTATRTVLQRSTQSLHQMRREYRDRCLEDLRQRAQADPNIELAPNPEEYA